MPDKFHLVAAIDTTVPRELQKLVCDFAVIDPCLALLRPKILFWNYTLASLTFDGNPVVSPLAPAAHFMLPLHFATYQDLRDHFVSFLTFE